MSTTKTISGIPVTAEWEESGGVWRAEGTASISELTLKGASLELDGSQFTGAVDQMSLDLFKGCSLTAGQTAFGLANGAAILRDVADAPVQRNETYLYFDAQKGMALTCAGLSLPLSGGSSNRLYLNPHDPSAYVQASNVLATRSRTGLANSVRNVAGVDVGEVTVGVSANGRIPWRATVAGADGKRETMNAHLVLGGDVAVKASQLRIAVREGSQAYRFDLNNQRLLNACSSGRLVIPDVVRDGCKQSDTNHPDGGPKPPTNLVFPGLPPAFLRLRRYRTLLRFLLLGLGFSAHRQFPVVFGRWVDPSIKVSSASPP